MWKKLIPGFTLISASLFLLGVSESVVRSQQLTETKDNLSRTIVRVADYVITAKDLSQIIDTYPPGSLSSREAKMRLVESLITGKLFALAAGEAKLDAAEDFPRARERAREDVLAYAYFKRHVKPKFTEEQARKYFTAHKEEY
ncbi:MAG: hypothetical protein ACE5GH_07935, partial [Fidelibacterota bacterium]